MNKTALTEKRRETVISLLKGMKIKESASGECFDKGEVHRCMQQLCDLYEEHIGELEKTYEAEIGDLTSKYQKYDDNNDLYISLIMEAKKSSNELIEQAKAEVDNILEEGRKRIETQEKEIVLLREGNEREKNELAKELAQTRELMETELAAMRVEVEAEKEKVEAIRSRYRQQIEAMTADFDVIKTNILRTAAKLDGLKTQVETVETDINWEVEEKAIAVEIPDGDITIEDEIVIPAEETVVSEPAEEPQVTEGDSVDVDFADVEETVKDIPQIDVLSIFGESADAPVEEAEEKAPVEDAVDSFADEFFKSEVLEEMPKVQPVEVEEAPVEVEETSAVEASEIPVEVIPEAAVEEVKLEEDIIDSVDNVEELLDKISFEDMLEEVPATEEMQESENEIEEISFEGLEELFKEEQ